MRSLKHISAYLFLHGKKVSKEAVDKFLSILQSDINSSKITRAKDKFHKEVDRIQRSLVGMSNAMFPGEVANIKIEPARKKHYEGIVKSQGLGSLPVIIAGAVSALTQHHIHKMFGHKVVGLSGLKSRKYSKVCTLSGIDESVFDDLADLYEKSFDTKNSNLNKQIPLSEKAIARIKEQTGKEFKNYSLIVYASEIKHTTKTHGGKHEKLTGQIPIDDVEEFLMFPIVVNNFDMVEFEKRGGKNKKFDTLKFTKKIGKRYFVVQEILGTSKLLRYKTMWIKKSPTQGIGDFRSANVAKKAPSPERPKRIAKLHKKNNKSKNTHELAKRKKEVKSNAKKTIKKVKPKKVVKKKTPSKKSNLKKIKKELDRDPEMKQIIAQTIKAGKAITSNKTVKASVNKAIEDLISIKPNLKKIGAMALNMFYNKFKEKQIGDKIEINGDFAETMFTKVGDYQLVHYNKKYHSEAELTETGFELIEKIKARLNTLKAKKAGTDLFPELAGVKQSPVPSGTRMKASEMKHMTFERLKFNPYYTGIFGSPAVNFDMCIHAGPGTGKTVFLLQFANYLAKNHGPVLYVTTEEYGSPTLVDKTERFGIDSDNLFFEKKVPAISELKKYKFIFIDSVNHAKINCEDYKKIRESVPNSAFILILQQTKGGTHKGGNDWPHEVEISMRMFKDEMNERWLDVEKDRYDNTRVVKI